MHVADTPPARHGTNHHCGHTPVARASEGEPAPRTSRPLSSSSSPSHRIDAHHPLPTPGALRLQLRPHPSCTHACASRILVFPYRPVRAHAGTIIGTPILARHRTVVGAVVYVRRTHTPTLRLPDDPYRPYVMRGRAMRCAGLSGLSTVPRTCWTARRRPAR